MFETNSVQNIHPHFKTKILQIAVSEPQRYKILKPIHNTSTINNEKVLTVSDHKDTKF